jgi:DDE superfamily endonuclease
MRRWAEPSGVTCSRHNPREVRENLDGSTSKCRLYYRPTGKWHLDAGFIPVDGVLPYLWRAVGHNGVVRAIPLPSRRDAGAARRFCKRLLKRLQYVSCVRVTGKPGSYGVARRELLPGVERRKSRYLANRAENPISQAGVGSGLPVRTCHDLSGLAEACAQMAA